MMDALDMCCLQQGSLDWYKARLGKITSSNIYNIMLMPTKKAQAEGEIFSETAKSYLYKVASERMLDNDYINDFDLFNEYLERVNAQTREMRYGSETEAIARNAYILQSDYEVLECGFVSAPDEAFAEIYGDSPDGVVIEECVPIGTLEIKCPKPETWIKYRAMFDQGKSLLEVEEKYYWQCQSHIYCNGVEWCDFVYFDKMQRNGLQIVRIERNQADIDAMLERITLANQFIENILKQF